MPTYRFRNKKNGKVKEEFMFISEMEEFLKDNPNWNIQIQPVAIVGEIGEKSKRLPEGFKDVLRNMKDKHPHGNGPNTVLGGDTSPIKNATQRMKDHSIAAKKLRSKDRRIKTKTKGKK